MRWAETCLRESERIRDEYPGARAGPVVPTSPRSMGLDTSHIKVLYMVRLNNPPAGAGE